MVCFIISFLQKKTSRLTADRYEKDSSAHNGRCCLCNRSLSQSVKDADKPQRTEFLYFIPGFSVAFPVSSFAGSHQISDFLISDFDALGFELGNLTGKLWQIFFMSDQQLIHHLFCGIP